MNAVLDQWEATNCRVSAASRDFTAIVKTIENRAGVTIGGKKS